MIETDGVAKWFGGIQAVDSCSISVARGSITGLIGPNGAGKSTLFNIVAGYLRADQGRVLLDGHEITGTRPHLLTRLGVARTFQIAHELKRMTVLDNLMVVPPQKTGETLWGAWFRRSRIAEDEERVRRRALDVLRFLRLDALAHEPAGNLSGGQKKLLELGRTMMAEARVVLLDEVGAGVNRTLLAELATSIERLNRELGCTFWLIEHDMELIGRLCHPVVVMAAGAVLAEGAWADIRRDPAVIEAYLGGGRAVRADA